MKLAPVRFNTSLYLVAEKQNTFALKILRLLDALSGMC
jgi:hypothetical protein